LPTLNLLAKAKAATLMFGKTADQIRKEFNFSNDMPAAEEAEVLHLVGELRRKRGLPWDEDQGVAPGATLLGGVWPLADAQEGGEKQAGQKSWRFSTWRAAIAEDWQQLARAPQEVRADRGLILAALSASRGMALQYASAAFQADREVVLAAVAAGGQSLQEASKELRSNRELVLEAVRLDATALGGASDALRSDFDFVQQAIQAGGGAALQGAIDTLRRDDAFVLRCAASDPRALQYAVDAVWEDRSFALKVVGSVAGALQYLPERLRADWEIVEAATAHDPASLAAAHASCRADILGGQAKEASEVRIEPQQSVPMQLGGAKDDARLPHGACRTHKLQKKVVFSAMSTITANVGQMNYIAANIFLDKVPSFTRPEIDSQAIMWGTIGGIGMRLKAFGSQDFMLQQPDLLMTAREAKMILNAMCTGWGTPEWMATQYFAPEVREMILRETVSSSGFTPSEDCLAYPRIPPEALKKQDKQFGSTRVASAYPEGSTQKGPLGGWPSMVGVEQKRDASGAKAAPPSEGTVLVAGPVGQEPAEGDIVQLVGLKSKSGLLGKVIKCYTEGRYRVALDGNKGSALLRPEYLQVMSVACC